MVIELKAANTITVPNLYFLNHAVDWVQHLLLLIVVLFASLAHKSILRRYCKLVVAGVLIDRGDRIIELGFCWKHKLRASPCKFCWYYDFSQFEFLDRSLNLTVWF